jgi:sugar phosphate isomerase/epimerase
MNPCLAQVSTLEASFADDVADYAAGKCAAIEIWLGKLDQYLESHSLDDVRKLLAEHDVTAPAASFQGGLLTSQGEARKVHWEAFERRLELCRDLSIGTLVLAADVNGPLAQQDLDRAQVSLTQAAAAAGKCGLRLALEFQARAAFINNLQTAAAVVAEVGSPHLGICLDAFHYYVGPSKSEDLGYLSSENLFHVQLCDLSGVAREFATDGERILPGEGDIPMTALLARLAEIDYRGHISIELMNPQIWRIPPRQFGEIAMTALRKLLGQASMD